MILIRNINAQSLVVNEVSQGPSGNKEYVELLVVPGNSSNSCSNSCLDLSNWILDDNNGYFSGGAAPGVGIANGAIRFKSDPFWQCVPVGTIILIYNDLDLNLDLPADDLSAIDGNFRLVIPISSTLFEHQSVSPSPTSMVYPPNGWTSGGSWGTLAMANGGDSFLVYSATNQMTPVHGVSWGNNNSNPIVYFANSASNSVFYFANAIDNNPSNQANWIAGNCSAADNQTPGLANNAANGNYISFLTNNYVSPLIATIGSSADASGCQCNGSASVNVSGSTPDYSFDWFNSENVALGQTAASATHLCAGTYYCIVSSSTNCSDTTQVTINNTNAVVPTFNSIPSICIGGVIDLPSISINGIMGNWDPAINNLETTTYTFTPNAGQCANSATITVNVDALINPQFDLWGPFCHGALLPQEILPETSFNGISGTWNPQMVSTENIGISSYTFTPNSNECAIIYNLDVMIYPDPTIFAGIDKIVCEGSSITLSASGGSTYAWTNSVSNGIPFVPTTSSMFYVIGTDANGCEGQDSVMVSILPLPSAAFTSDVSVGFAPLTVQFANISSNATNYYWDFGNGSTLSVDNLNTVNSSYVNKQTYEVWLTASNGICADSTFRLIDVVAPGEPVISVPNVFSPNGDNANDFWFIEAKNIESIQINILNRWGNLMKEMNSLTDVWDGKTENGEEVTNGTYFYKYSAKALNGQELIGNGFITIVR